MEYGCASAAFKELLLRPWQVLCLVATRILFGLIVPFAKGLLLLLCWILDRRCVFGEDSESEWESGSVIRMVESNLWDTRWLTRAKSVLSRKPSSTRLPPRTSIFCKKKEECDEYSILCTQLVFFSIEMNVGVLLEKENASPFKERWSNKLVPQFSRCLVSANKRQPTRNYEKWYWLSSPLLNTINKTWLAIIATLLESNILAPKISWETVTPWRTIDMLGSTPVHAIVDPSVPLHQLMLLNKNLSSPKSGRKHLVNWYEAVESK